MEEGLSESTELFGCRKTDTEANTERGQVVGWYDSSCRQDIPCHTVVIWRLQKMIFKQRRKRKKTYMLLAVTGVVLLNLPMKVGARKSWNRITIRQSMTRWIIA